MKKKMEQKTTKKYKVYFDGNKSAGGVSCSYLILGDKSLSESNIEQTVMLPENTTVPEAEYNGLIKALEFLIAKVKNPEDVELEIFGDSQLIVNQVLGKFECTKPQLKILRSKVRNLLDKFNKWLLVWVPRQENLVK